MPGLAERLAEGASVADLACGAGVGLARLAGNYPNCSLIGVDGDAYSVKMASERLNNEGAQDRTTLVRSSLEDLDASGEYDVAVNNISMHECRDIEQSTANIYRALRPGGYFVISDFPFPERAEELRSIPSRIMAGIQFFEATIDDQLLPVKAYVELLNRHGFRNVGTVELTPVHALTYGQK